MKLLKVLYISTQLVISALPLSHLAPPSPYPPYWAWPAQQWGWGPGAAGRAGCQCPHVSDLARNVSTKG